jgi:FkbM family methyltransferase
MKRFIDIYHFIAIFGIRKAYKFLSMRYSRIVRLFLPALGTQIFIRSGTSDEWLLYQIFSRKQYHIKLPKIHTIIDLGANIGLASLYFKLLYPDALIIGVEPDTNNYDLLVKNTRHLDRVILYNNAISSVSGHGYLYQPNDLQPWAIRSSVNKPETPVIGTVEFVTIPQILKNHHLDTIDILKIDIEGAEALLFDNNYEEWLPCVQNIIIEIHDDIYRGAGQKFFRAIHKCFGEYQFSIKGSNVVISRSDG